VEVEVTTAPQRERLPATRQSITRKFKIQRPGDQDGPLKMYATVGLYDDGRPGELFLKADKAGTFSAGALDALATVLSVAWQHGVPFEPLVQKLVGLRFDPMGATGDREFPLVASPLDYVARWLLARFGKKEEPQP
jgi:ribonucleoside-diphosphate reductase alpha chain